VFYLIFAAIRLMAYAVVGLVRVTYWVLRMMVMLVMALAAALVPAHASHKRAHVAQGRHRSG
jgi:hypothetical protein